MYSVEDLLISHGYKLPQNTSATAPPTTSPTPPASYDNKRYGDPASCRQEILENRSGGGHGAVNGYETNTGPGVYVYGNSTSRQPLPPAPTKGCTSSNSDNEWRDRTGQPQQREADSGNQGDMHSLGGTLTADSGFYDGPKGVCSQSRGPRDVSYWRRRGQDFSILLDYADLRDPRGGGRGGYRGPEGVQPLRQEVPPEEQQRERQRWAAQARSRQREAALHQWRMAAVERKCQSLGPDEWRPAVVSFARQLSDSEGEKWAQEQQQQLQQRPLRTPDGAVVVVGPRNKGKSQSLPRMLQPESLQYVDVSGLVGSAPGQDGYRRVNGHPGSHPDPYSRYNLNLAEAGDRWPENDRPSSQASMVSQASQKPRFPRPPRPPSYEVHQQTRGSAEMLSGEPVGASTPQPQARDRTPLPHFGMVDPRIDYYIHDGGSGTEPPGYIPPPSYPPKRVLMRGGPGGHRAYGEIPVNYRYLQMYQQMRGTPDPWFGLRHTSGGSWPEPHRDPHRERSMPHRMQLYPGYCKLQHQQGLGPGVQYIPFDDPRVRHLPVEGNSSLGCGGSGLTDADKIRHIRNSASPELPSVTVSDHSSDASAFLSPASTGAPLALSSTPDQASPTPLRAPSDIECNNWEQRQHIHLHKEAENLDNFPTATDQNCNRYDPKKPLGCPSAFQPTAPAPAQSVRHSSNTDQGIQETITQVKKIAPGDSGLDNNRQNKRKSHSETIFCLVSVPVHMQQQSTKHSVSADQNNNQKMPASLPTVSVVTTDDNQNTVAKSQTDNRKSLRSKSLSDMGLKPPTHTSSFTSMRCSRKAPLRKEMVDVWSLQANADKELCYAGSWPGNQYRNQETQTSSPVAVKSPERTRVEDQTQSQEEQGGQEPGHSAADTTVDSGVGTECSSGSYGLGCPMKGQKNLNLSSNSAFSRLSISPAQPPSLPPLPAQPPPAVPGVETDQHTSTSRKTSGAPTTTKTPGDVNANNEGQQVFGQFLLKPVSRRPWDAIEELECFNKAAGVDLDQVEKKQKVQARRPSLDQRIDDLDQVYMNIMELSGEVNPQQQHPQHQQQHIASLDPDRETCSLPEQHIRPNQPSNNNVPTIRPRLDSWGPGTSMDPDYRELRSAFSRPQPHSRTCIPRPQRVVIGPPATQLTGFRDYIPHNAPCGPKITHDTKLSSRQDQDIPVPKESLLRDVGLTVYTEGPGEQGKPRTPPLTRLSPSDHTDIHQNIETIGNRPSVAGNSQVDVVHISECKRDDHDPAKVGEVKRKVKADNIPIVPPRFKGHEPNLKIRRARSENSKLPEVEGSQRSPYTGRLITDEAFAFEDDHYRYGISSDALRWRSEVTLADRHLETLLIKEKANAMPAEDLSNLYEVKCAKGIPKHETMEQRAARILGIDVAPDSLHGGLKGRKLEQRDQGKWKDHCPDREQQNEDNDETEIQAEESLSVIQLPEEDQLLKDNSDEGRTMKEETLNPSPDGGTSEHSPDRGTSEHSPDRGTSEHSPDRGISEHSPDRGTSEHSPDGSTWEHSPDGKRSEHSPDRGTWEHGLDRGTWEHSPEEVRETKHVRRQYEQVMDFEVSMVTLEEGVTEKQEGTGTGSSDDDILSVCENRHDGQELQSNSSMAMELPEFPPSRLPLSLPQTPDDELALSVLSVDRGAERKGRSSGGASPRLSSSSSSPGHIETEVPMAKVFTVSWISFKTSDSGGQFGTKLENDEWMSPEEDKREEEMEEEQSEKEMIDIVDKREYDRMEAGEEETENREMQKRERQAAEEKTEERREDRRNNPDEDQQQEAGPVCRPVKPPLLPKPVPKPRTGIVAKREISLPLGFNVSSCDSFSNLEDDELLSDSYDPSRVERV
ncbi:hypothetical protein UPYG_G00076350 [Umbra pygmaea]|uniref:Junctional protein associated with coronary artery disease n=1 Tax=Umbra pygmaea TaxID=75934 RepID=A0ABD0XCT0_UMBPY